MGSARTAVSSKRGCVAKAGCAHPKTPLCLATSKAMCGATIWGMTSFAWARTIGLPRSPPIHGPPGFAPVRPSVENSVPQTHSDL
jgi:hypothetical protein